MLDIFYLYMIIGLVVNWGVSLFALYGDEGDEIEIDAFNFFLTIPTWPITVYNIVRSLISKD